MKWKNIINFNFTILSLILLSLTSLLLYYPSIDQFFSLDDTLYIQSSRNINDVFSFLNIFTHAVNPQTYRPLSTYIYVSIIDRIFGVDPFYYHVMNILIHTINSYLVFFLVFELSKKKIIALLSSFIYVTRSALTMSIFWISGGEEILMVLFFLFTFIFYLKYKNKTKSFYLFLSLGFFILSLLSKETVVILPFLIILYDFLFSNKKLEMKNLLNSIKNSWPFLFILCFYLIVRFSITYLPTSGPYQWAIGYHIVQNIIEYIFFSFDLFEINLWALFTSFSLFTLLIIFFMFYLLFSKEKKMKFKGRINIILFVVIWYFVGMFPIIFMPERHSPYYLSISLIGFSILISYILFHFCNFLNNVKFKLGILLLFLVVISVLYLSNKEILEIYQRSDIYEASQIMKGCIENMKNYHFDDNDSLFFKGDSEKLYWASDNGEAFKILLGKQVITLFEFKDTAPSKVNFIFEYNNFSCKLY